MAIPGMRESLAKEFEVAESTVDKWKVGSAKPHPLMQNKIVNKIKEIAGN